MSSKSKRLNGVKRATKKVQQFTPDRPQVVDLEGNCPGPGCGKPTMASIFDGTVRTIVCRTCGGGSRGRYPGGPTEQRSGWGAAWEPVKAKKERHHGPNRNHVL